jgi:hypothetical protein
MKFVRFVMEARMMAWISYLLPDDRYQWAMMKVGNGVVTRAWCICVVVEGDSDIDRCGPPAGILIHPFFVRGAVIEGKTIVYVGPVCHFDLCGSKIVGRYDLHEVR